MIDLTLTQHRLLRQVISAGPEGLHILAPSAALMMGDLMKLALDDLIDVRDRRVFATARGRAFAARTAA